MKKKLQSITNKGIPIFVILVILCLWQLVSSLGMIPKYMLPSPFEVMTAFVADFGLLMEHAKITLTEAFLGLLCGITLGLIVSVCMDCFPILYKACYPLLILSQTIPTIAIAPLLVLWLGYDMAPKVTLVVITTFFPITVGLLDGFKAADTDTIRLLQSMGATKRQVFCHIKFPGSLSFFFAGLRVSAAYAVVGAVISEWLGGYNGLGVYMVRVKKSYAFDKMFAVIFLISLISLGLIWLVDCIQKCVMPWDKIEKRRP